MTSPTPEEIREMCREIQDGWTETQARQRAEWAFAMKQVETREVAISSVVEACKNQGDG